jgi:hypothetical protein
MFVEEFEEAQQPHKHLNPTETGNKSHSPNEMAHIISICRTEVHKTKLHNFSVDLL